MFSMIVAKKLVGNVRPELYDEAQRRGPTARDKYILDLIQGNGHWLGQPQDLDVYVWWVKGYLGKMCNAGTVQALLNSYTTMAWQKLKCKGVLVRRLVECDGEVGLAINGLTKRCPATLASKVVKLIHRGASPSPLYPDLSMCRDWIVEKSATDKELEECINKLVKADPSWYLGTERTQTNTNYLADMLIYPARVGTVGLDKNCYTLNEGKPNHATDAEAYALASLSLSQPQSKEENSMKTVQTLNIRTVTFIGNNPADQYSDEQIYSLIAEREATINYYTAMKNQPERLKVSLTTIQKEIDDLVKIVDARV